MKGEPPKWLGQLSRPAAPVRTKADIHPIFCPFFSPCERLVARRAYFRREVSFLDHFRHSALHSSRLATSGHANVRYIFIATLTIFL